MPSIRKNAVASGISLQLQGAGASKQVPLLLLLLYSLCQHNGIMLSLICVHGAADCSQRFCV